MVSITVDGNIFTFPADWEVEQYDTWDFYAKIGGGHVAAKACDLVAIGGATLYLIEAKDYTYPVGTRPPSLSDLSRTVAQKGFHTLAGIFAGARYDQPQQEFCRRALACHQVELCLSVEFPEDKGLLFRQRTFLMDIRELLVRDARPFIARRPLVVSNKTGGAPWTSSRDPSRRV